MRWLIAPMPRKIGAPQIFLLRTARALEKIGHEWTALPFHYTGFNVLPWDRAFVMGVPRNIDRIINSGKKIIVTMGKPDRIDEAEATGQLLTSDPLMQVRRMLVVLRSVTKPVLISEYTRIIWRNVFKEIGEPTNQLDQAEIIHHGIDCTAFSPIKSQSDEFIIGTAGNFRWKMRIDLMFKISQMLDFPHHLFFLGPMTDECRNYFCEWSERLKSPRCIGVRWQPRVNPDALPNYYRRMSCLFHPVDFESFGIVVAEAMACGVPVIAPSHGAISEYLGQGGILVRTRQFDYGDNSVNLYADAIKKIKYNHLVFSQNAREQATDKLCIIKQTKKYINILE